MSIVESKIYKMRPGYLPRYDSLVKKFSQFGGGAEDNKYIEGHGFSSAYEFYIFAFFIGLYAKSPLDLSSDDKLKDFWEIENWKPRTLTNHLLSCAIAESDFDMVAVENFDEQAVTLEVKKLRMTIERYANGGFEIIQNRIEKDPDEVSGDYFFVNMINI